MLMHLKIKLEIHRTAVFLILVGLVGGGTLFALWIIAFPLYLMKRNKLIALAKAHPSEPTNRNLKIGVFSIIAIVSIWWNIWG
jgi:hypothetical protein